MLDIPPGLAEPLGSREFVTARCEAVRAEMLTAVGQVWRVQTGDLAEVAGAVAGVKAACDAMLVAMTREAISRGVVLESTAVNPTAWLAEATGTEPRAVSPVAGAGVVCLEPGNAPVADRVLSGTMAPAMAVKIVREVG